MLDFLTNVRIKKTGESGFVVSVGRENDAGIRQYLVEKDDQYKDGENDLDWYYEEELKEM